MPASPHLDRAYQIASLHRPRPNPRVGAVVVSPAGGVIGEGAHAAAGAAHAEVLALEDIDATGATVYVTLEPCAHHGRTPPCVDRLIEAKVARVVVGALDPDQRVSGSGIRRLEQADIEVEVVNEPDAEALDPGYFHHRRTGNPLVTLKFATTVDGSAAARDGTSRWITGAEARMDVHLLRSRSDAVVVGSGTVASDDPRLDVRLDGYQGHQPRPVVVAGVTPLETSRQVWGRDPLVFTPENVEVPGGEQIVTKSNPPEPVDVCQILGDRGIYDVLVEGGPTIAGAWWRSGVVNRVVVYVGSKMGGGSGMSPLGGVFNTIDSAEDVSIEAVTRLGEDIRIDYLRS